MSDPRHRRAAFVVGGSGGLGMQISRRLETDWDHVFIGYRNGRKAAEAVAKEIGDRATAIRCDVGDYDALANCFTQAQRTSGPIGTVVFASGVAIRQPFVHAIKETDWREVVEAELIGFTRVVAATLPFFRAAGSGSYVAITTVANYGYPPGDALSSVPKAAVESLCRAIAKEEGRFGIRANAVAPGLINAGLGRAFLNELYNESIWEKQRRRVALRRFGEAIDIAEAVAYLSSDRARYVTGQTLVVDGGFSL